MSEEQATKTTIEKPAENPPSFKKNYLFSLVVQVLTYLIPLITAPYLSRVLTPSGVGVNSFANSIATYFTLIIAFGFLTFGTKEVSRLHTSKKEYSAVFWNIVFSRLFIFCLAFPAYFLMAYFWGFGSSVDKSVFLIYSLTLIATLLTITFLFQGLENFKTISLITIGVRVTAAVLYFLLVKSTDDLLTYIAIYVSTNLCIAVLSWAFAIPKIEKPHRKDIHIFKSLKNNLAYFLPTIAISVYTILDHTMIGYLSTTEEVGYYEEAYKITTVIVGLVNAVGPVTLARISALIAEGNEAEVEHKILQTSELYGILAFPCFFGLYAVGRYFVPTYFGAEYLPAVSVLYWLTPLILIIPISGQVQNFYYAPRNKIATTIWFFLAGGSVNFISNFFAIPAFGARGAAMTSLAAETIISFCFVLFSRKEVPYRKILKVLIKPLLASAIMFGALMAVNYWALDPYLSKGLWKTLIDVGTGVLLYFGLCLLFREPMLLTMLHKVFKHKSREEVQQ